ncbi:peptide chain release factor 1 [Dethiosulfovibrio salsuginis]|uniref:Peptide chain release factor 1 n=1 Tax=Dethiosulfovibrio salsuginis TaxID=561720 RepID=A0A1X7KRJ0_9BACT|nr:peptide chain release factor 1 [Dethiosulfovibrio salsuginis]SMG43831.1 bacterial peptide chain release factor 1 (bRF-1) [Dethiosulfovibrio salsuginis]
MNLDYKLQEIMAAHEEIEHKMADPSITSDPKELQALGKKHAELSEIVEAYKSYLSVKSELDGARDLLGSGDREMELMAKEEINRLESLLDEREQAITFLLLPKDPNDDKSVIVEIRAGTGGEEAALFASDLFRMYSRYAETRRWSVDVIESNETEIGGYREIVFKVDGQGAYSDLKYESGVHRVQRVPETESGGRIHTSAATVAVLPEAEEFDVDIRTEDLKIDTYRASGAGGQHVNMTDSAVRITHLPTGLVVTCQDERSQIKNRARAMAFLRTKLYDMERQKRHDAEAQQRKGQIGSGDRSERIRTYNYPQNRLTDHRIGLTLYKLESIMEGTISELIEPLRMADRAELLKAMNDR